MSPGYGTAGDAGGVASVVAAIGAVAEVVAAVVAAVAVDDAAAVAGFAVAAAVAHGWGAAVGSGSELGFEPAMVSACSQRKRPGSSGASGAPSSVWPWLTPQGCVCGCSPCGASAHP